MDLFSLVATLALDTSKYEEAVKAAKQTGESIDDLDIGVYADTSGAEADISSLKSCVEDVGDVDIDATADTDEAESNISGLSSSAGNLNGTTVEIDANADTDSAKTNLDSLTDSLNSAVTGSGGLNDGLSDVAGGISSLVGALAGGTLAKAFMDIANAIWEAADAAATKGDNIDKDSQRLGLTTDEYQQWDALFNLNGTSIGEQGRLFRTLNNQIAKARTGNEDAKTMFDALGISIDESSTAGNTLGSVLQAIGQNQNLMDQFGADLLGAGYMTLQPMFNAMNNFDENGVSAYAQQLAMIANMTFMTPEAIAAAANNRDWKYIADTSAANNKYNLANDIGAVAAQTGMYQAQSDFWNGTGGVSQYLPAGLADAVNKLKSGNATDLIELLTGDGGNELYNTLTGLGVDGVDGLLEQLTTGSLEGTLYDQTDMAALAANIENALSTVTLSPAVDTSTIQNQLDQGTYWVNTNVSIGDTSGGTNGDDGSHWGGMDYVPYDGYRAVLHEGERILNSNDADATRGNSGLVAAIQQAFSTVSVNMNGTAVGNITASTVDRNIGRKARAGRYRT